MKIGLIVIGKTDAGYFVEAINEYKNRLTHYIPFEMEVIPDIKNVKNLSEAQQKEKEGELILKALQPGDYLVLLDEKGKEFTSMQFSTYLEKKMHTVPKRLVFVVGGPYGFSEAVYKAASEKISLSKMTFSHQMIRLIFIEQIYRPSHADYTYQTKYGIRDPRGGGRSSARETIARCVAGAIAKLALKQYGIQIQAYTSQVGPIKLAGSYQDYDLSLTEKSDVRCPDPKTASEMETLIAEVKSKGDTIGGVITCVAKGVPVGLGEPVFGKLHAALGHAMLTINAVKGFEYGDGFNAAFFRGSERNDRFFNDNGHINTRTNNSGGIQGGISNGQDIYFRVAFKSVATILMEQETVNMEGEDTILKARGRHDPCVLPRAVPIVESMTAMTLLDYLLIQKTRENF